MGERKGLVVVEGVNTKLVGGVVGIEVVGGMVAGGVGVVWYWGSGVICRWGSWS